MKSLLKNLDEKFGHWLDTMDGQLNEPIARIMTGEVFTHGERANGHSRPTPPARPSAPPATITGHARREPEPDDYTTGCLPALRPADAT